MDNYRLQAKTHPHPLGCSLSTRHLQINPGEARITGQEKQRRIYPDPLSNVDTLAISYRAVISCLQVARVAFAHFLRSKVHG